MDAETVQIPSKTPMLWLHFILAQFPLLYRELLRHRRHPNLEKVLFLSVLKRRDAILDIGANRGYFTILFSHIVGKGGKVHGFEPVPTTFEHLRHRVRREGVFENVILHRCALGNEVGETVIYLPDQDDGQASMRPGHQAGSWRAVGGVKAHPCPLQTLDHYCRDWPRLDFVKCDVEGAELLVLQGAGHTVSRCHPMICLEVFGAWTKTFSYHPMDVVSQLVAWGYQRFYVCTGTCLQLLDDPQTYFRDPPPESVNLLATIPEFHGDRTRHLDAICTQAR